MEREDKRPILGVSVSERTNRLAVTGVERAALKLGWFFRAQDVSDQGIDAHVEKFTLEKSTDGQSHEIGTGRLIAIQIKGGSSYFREPSADGWWFRFGEKKRKLWLGHALPVVVVLVDVEHDKLYWQRISPKTVVNAGKGFKVNVPALQTVAKADAVWVDLASGLERDAQSRFEYSLLSLPPSVSAKLKMLPPGERGNAALLALHLAKGRGNPRGTLISLVSTRPTWIESNPSWGWRAVANYAIEYGMANLAADALEYAEEKAESASRATLLASAAILRHHSDPQQAGMLLARAHKEATTAEEVTVILAVAQTVMSRRTNDPDLWDVHPLLLSDSAEVRASVPAQRTLALAARQRNDLDEAVLHARAALELDETSTESMSLLASIMLARWGGNSTAGADLDSAVDLLQTLIRQRRMWAGPTKDQLDQLARALFLAGRLEDVLRATLPPPYGTADSVELDPRCVRIAAHAAHRLGRRDALDEAVALLGEDSLDLLAKVQVGALTLSREEIIGLRLQGLDAAIKHHDYEEIARHAMALIADGVDVRERLQPYVDLSVFPRTLLALASALLTARSDLDAALPELRELARTNAIAAENLIGLLSEASRHREAASEAQALFELTHSNSYLIHRANALIAADAGAEAIAAAEDAVAHTTTQPFDACQLLTFLGVEAANRGDWAAAETHLSRVLDIVTQPSDDQVWRLVSCLIMQGRIKRAAKTVADYRPQVSKLEQAWLWFHSHAMMRWNQRIAVEAYALAERFSDPKLSIALLNRIILGTRGTNLVQEPSPGNIPEGEHNDIESVATDEEDTADLQRRRELAQHPVPGELHRNVFDLMGKLSDQYGEATGITILKGSTEELLEQMVQRIRPNAERDTEILDLAQNAREGNVPIGFLAGVLGKPVATLVLQRALGVLVASSPHNDEHDLDVAAAQDAMNLAVVVDTTAVATLTGLSGANALTGRFASLLVSPSTMHDFHRAAFDIQGLAGSPGTLGWDSRRDRLTIAELGEQEFSRLWTRAEQLTSYTDHLTVSSFGDSRFVIEFSTDPRHSAWADVLELAGDRALPIWSDDLALRRLARSLKIPAFCTSALVDAIRDAALVAASTLETEETAIERAAKLNLELARDFIVDLPISRDELLRLAEEDNWKPGCGAAILSRPAWWAGNIYAIETLRLIYQGVQAAAPAHLAAWQFAAMNGVARLLPPDAASHSLAGLVLMGFGRENSEQELADGLLRARDIASELGYPDPAGALHFAAHPAEFIRENEDRNDLIGRVVALADAEASRFDTSPIRGRNTD